jgi:hypothetical protein
MKRLIAKNIAASSDILMNKAEMMIMILNGMTER